MEQGHWKGNGRSDPSDLFMYRDRQLIFPSMKREKSKIEMQNDTLPSVTINLISIELSMEQICEESVAEGKVRLLIKGRKQLCH